MKHSVPPATLQALLDEIESCDIEAAAASADGGVLFDGPIRDRECAAAFSAVRLGRRTIGCGA